MIKRPLKSGIAVAISIGVGLAMGAAFRDAGIGLAFGAAFVLAFAVNSDESLDRRKGEKP